MILIRPPIPVEEKNREVKEGLEEKSPESMSEFIVKITKVGQKSGLLIEAVTFDTQVKKKISLRFISIKSILTMIFLIIIRNIFQENFPMNIRVQISQHLMIEFSNHS